MLSQLYIENIAVIQKASIDFSSGLNVFTGETGAGKTVLISAINAVLGERTSREIIRSGETRALVSAVFTEIPEDVEKRIAALGFDAEDGQYVIDRELDADGKGSCRVNGRPAVTATLRQVSSLLIDIHGQHDNQELLSAEKHMGFLDSYGQLSGEIAAYRAAYDRMTEIRGKLDAVQMDEDLKLQRIDILQYQTREIEAAALTDGEEEELEEQKEIIRNAEKISGALGTIYSLLSGDDETEGMIGTLDDVSGALSTAAGYVGDFSAYTEKVQNARYDLEDLSATARQYLDESDFDPRQLDDIESRLDVIYRLKKKYGGSIAEVLAYGEKAGSELAELTSSDEVIARLKKELAAAQADAQRLADALTQKRGDTAKTFTDLVEKELAYLDMASVRLVLSQEKKPLSPNGQDKIEFLISANPGEPPRPLAKIASGGELSRIMLAIKNVLADRDALQTMIFDEVDAGVSGRAAQKIGAKLAEVSKNRQVIVVTHLAQVAAYAKRHIRIYKTVHDGRTYTAVEVLDREQRKRELARIMVGENISEAALRSADEMLILSGNCR